MPDMMLFRVGDRSFAVPLPMVKNVYERSALKAPEGNTDRWMLNRQPVELFDLKTLFGAGEGEAVRVMRIECQGQAAAFIVDRIEGVTRVTPGTIHDMPPAVFGEVARWFPQVVQISDGLAPVINPPGMLGIPETQPAEPFVQNAGEQTVENDLRGSVESNFDDEIDLDEAIDSPDVDDEADSTAFFVPSLTDDDSLTAEEDIPPFSESESEEALSARETEELETAVASLDTNAQDGLSIESRWLEKRLTTLLTREIESGNTADKLSEMVREILSRKLADLQKSLRR